MTDIELFPCHPVLRAVDGLLREDGFTLVSADEDETTYTRSQAGWTARIRALVNSYEPQCNCPYCTVCEDEASDSLKLEIEMEREDLGHSLRGDVEADVSDAVETYTKEIRPLIASFPRRVHQLNCTDIQPDFSRWQDTLFVGFHVLKYLGNIRWRDGQLDEAHRCYQALLSSPICQRLPGWQKDVKLRLDELSRGVRYEERAALFSWGV
jgi:hypothetical protein